MAFTSFDSAAACAGIAPAFGSAIASGSEHSPVMRSDPAELLRMKVCDCGVLRLMRIAALGMRLDAAPLNLYLRLGLSLLLVRGLIRSEQDRRPSNYE